MELTIEEFSGLTKLTDSCQEMIEGKFILADAKISNILRCITKCKKVYELLSECMTNFNYEKEFARARIKSPTKPSKFIVPEETYKLLPMVFCILVDIENHKIVLNGFIKEFFKSEDGDEFACFTQKLILPFKLAIENIFLSDAKLVDDNSNVESLAGNENGITESNLADEPIFDRLVKIIDEIASCLSADAKIADNFKQDGLIMLRAMKAACAKEDLFMLNALIVGFEFYSKKLKSIKFIYQELKDTLTEYYANQGENE